MTKMKQNDSSKKGLMKQTDFIFAVTHFAAVMKEGCGSLCSDGVSWARSGHGAVLDYWIKENLVIVNVMGTSSVEQWAIQGYCVAHGIKFIETFGDD